MDQNSKPRGPQILVHVSLVNKPWAIYAWSEPGYAWSEPRYALSEPRYALSEPDMPKVSPFYAQSEPRKFMP